MGFSARADAAAASDACTGSCIVSMRLELHHWHFELALELAFTLRSELHCVAGRCAGIGTEDGTGAGAEDSTCAGTEDSACNGAEDSVGTEDGTGAGAEDGASAGAKDGAGYCTCITTGIMVLMLASGKGVPVLALSTCNSWRNGRCAMGSVRKNLTHDFFETFSCVSVLEKIGFSILGNLTTPEVNFNMI